MTLRGVVLDLDGTIYHGENPLPGAAAAVDRIRDRGLSLCFFSNNPLYDGRTYVDRLQEMGVDARPGEACSSAVVTREYVDEHHAGDGVFIIGSDALRETIRETGAEILAEPSGADVLLTSWTDDFHYRDMVDALRAIDDGTAFLGTDPDPTFQNDDGNLVPGSGAITRAVSGVIERDPERVLGKPSDVAIDAAVDILGSDPAESLVVGDRLETDIRLGERAGMQTALVRSGVTDEAALERSDVTPDYIIDSLAEIDSVLDSIN